MLMTNRNKVQEYLFVGFNGEDVWQKAKTTIKKNNSKMHGSARRY